MASQGGVQQHGHLGRSLAHVLWSRSPFPPSSTWALRPESANQEKRGGCFSRGCRSWAKRGGCFSQYFCPGLRPQLKPCGPQMTLAFRPESASQAKQGGYGGDMRPQSKPCCPQRVMGISGYGFNPNKTRRVRPQSELTSCVWPKQFKYNFTETVLKLYLAKYSLSTVWVKLYWNCT